MNYRLASDQAILADLAEQVDRIRKRKAMRDSDLAEAGGVSRQLISDFRNGKRSISLQSFVRVLRGLGELDRLQAAFMDEPIYRPSVGHESKQPDRVRKKEPKPGFFAEEDTQ